MNINVKVTDQDGKNQRDVAANTIESVTAVTTDCCEVKVGNATLRANVSSSELLALVAASAAPAPQG